MRKYIWSAKILLPLLVVLLVAVAYAGVPTIKSWWKEKAVEEPVAAVNQSLPYTQAEDEILSELLTVCARMEKIQQFSVEGNIHASDPSDSANVLRTDFRYCRDGQRFYYKAGDNETVTLPDAYVTVNSKVRKIFLSPPMEVLPPLQLPLDTLMKVWKTDRYLVTKSVAAPLVTVNLVCENHITCKQYRFTYDQDTRLLTRVFMRLTDMEDPLNKKRDKPVEIIYSHWVEGKVQPELFSKRRYVEGEADRYTPGKLYQDYEVVVN